MSLSENYYQEDSIGLSLEHNLDFFASRIYKDFILGKSSYFSFSCDNITLRVIVRVDNYFLIKPYLNSNTEIIFEMCFFDKPSIEDIRGALLTCIKQLFRRAVTLDDDTFQVYNLLDNLN